MSKLKNTVLVAATIFALSGCSAGNSNPEASSPSTASPSVTTTASSEARPDPLQSMPSVGIDVIGDSVPKPNAEQAKTMSEYFGFIHTELYTAASLERSRRVCEGILAGDDDAKLLELTHSVYDGTISTPLSEPQIADILKVIKTNGYCVKK